MRDIFLLLVFPFLLVAAIKRSFIAVSLWLWTALFFPNGWVYGIGQSIRFNLIFSVIAILGVFVSLKKTKSEVNSLTMLITLFILWATITSSLGMANPDIVWEYWGRFVKIVALYYCTIFLLTKKLHVDVYIWSIILSVGFYAFVEGLKLVASGGGHQIHGISGHVFDDRNSLALGIDMAIPLVMYLMSQNKLLLVKWGLRTLVFIMVLCVLGTYSRGGLIGLIVIGVYYFKNAKNKIFPLIAVSVIILVVTNLMSEQWFHRMDTIGEADQDASFMGRVVAWKISTLIALDHPFVGGGFKAVETLSIWIKYALEIDKLDMISTPPVNLRYARAAHSIYFQTLGDHGFVGLFLLLSLLWAGYSKTSSLIKKAKLIANDRLFNLAQMLRLSVITYAAVGSALSLTYFDLIFAVYSIIRVTELQYDG